MKVALASDHAGYSLKETIRQRLAEWGLEVADFGTHSPAPVDYPDYAAPVGAEVAARRADTGILCCGTGVGMCIAVNKIAGVRGAIAWTPAIARLSREHNDANVLCLGGRFLTPSDAEAIIKVWLETVFAGGRHQQRIDKVSALERH